ncbi:MAG: UDP-N-acetylglucosamine 1-carboxyvinyltransferase [Candidatus Komeilibacteria bacterium]|nr:UDP-N-acetylglucosamine 1-carboxyvinyltransferase [Candidatus Komeilibacteria bacterium]
MAKYIIQGGQTLRGEIKVSGAKNNALKAIPAALLTDQECVLHNVPAIEDIRLMLAMLSEIDIKGEYVGNTLTIKADRIKAGQLNQQKAGGLRSSIMLIPPLLIRTGRIFMHHPGGCIIGRRPINFFIDGFAKFGATIKFTAEGYDLKLARLRPATIVFPQISHTGTEAMILMAVLAPGTSHIYNAACEPEVVALCDMLTQMGANIDGAGTPHLEIKGVKKLNGCDFTIIPDRIEAGSFVILAALNRAHLQIGNCRPENMQVPLEMFRQAGINIKTGADFIKVIPTKQHFKPLKLTTHEYPGFPTDLQAPFTVLLTQAKGYSLIHETIYESRLFYTDMLNRMGADIIMCDPHRAIVHGPTPLRAKNVESPDLRAGIAMVIAATIAEGQSSIDNIYQIERGYEDIVTRLQGIGVSIVKKT